MLEYAVLLSQKPISDTLCEKIALRYKERSILTHEDQFIQRRFWKSHGMIVGRYRFEHQGIPYISDEAGFLGMCGWVLHDCLGDNHFKVVTQVYAHLRNGRTDWLEDSLGEFQLVFLQGKLLKVMASEMMTHPVYYLDGDRHFLVSNRASLTHILSDTKPRLDIQGQLELIAFDSMVNERTAFADTKCLFRGHEIECSFQNGFNWQLVRKPELWSDKEKSSLSIRKGVQQLEELKTRIVRQLHLIPHQINVQSQPFQLSGGKDSRVLLALLRAATVHPLYDGLLTYDFSGSSDAHAAAGVARYLGLPHTIIKDPKLAAEKIGFFSSFPHHYLLYEGEMNMGHFFAQPPVRKEKKTISGHEAGLREKWFFKYRLDTEKKIKSHVFSKIPVDHIHIISREERYLVMTAIDRLVDQALEWDVAPTDVYSWIFLVSRGCRWIGKITSMSSASELYMNILCSRPIARFMHNIGYVNRYHELFHFGMLYHLDKGLISIPFANQDWTKKVKREFRREIHFPTSPYSASFGESNWRQRFVTANHGMSFLRLLQAARHSAFDGLLDYERIACFVKNPSFLGPKDYSQLIAVLHANVLFQVGDITREALREVEMIAIELEKEYHHNCLSVGTATQSLPVRLASSAIESRRKRLESWVFNRLQRFNYFLKIYLHPDSYLFKVMSWLKKAIKGRFN